MDAKELRLGNLVLVGGIVQVVSGIREDPITFLVDGRSNQSVRAEKVEPIKLTEEWLLKFGFDYPSRLVGTATPPIKVFTSDVRNLKIVENQGVGKSGYVVLIENAFSLPHIKYVHSLQNLYKALTGEELGIQEDQQILPEQGGHGL